MPIEIDLPGAQQSSTPSSLSSNFSTSLVPIPKKPQSQTAVGTVEETIGAGLQKVTDSPLGYVLNPLMTGMQWLYKHTFEPAIEEASAVALYPQVSSRYPELSASEAYNLGRDYANEISFGQSWARLPWALAASSLEESPIVDSLPEFAQPNFNMFDEEERDTAFKSNFFGWAASSFLDLGAIVFTEKATGPVWRGAKGMALGRNEIKNAKDLARYEERLDRVQEWADSGQQTPALGDTRLIQELVESNDPLQLARNPLIANGSVANPDRAVAILSGMDDYKSVITYLKAERGNRQALREMWDVDPVAADSLDNFGVRFEPITDLSQINALPSVQRSEQLLSIYQSWVAKNPNFARAIDDFIAEAESGAGLSTYMSRQSLLGRGLGAVGLGGIGSKIDAGMDRAAVPRGVRKAQSQFGPLEGDGARSMLFENGPFKRAIRVITVPSRARRKAEINLSNPRQNELAWQVMSELNRVRALSTPENLTWKQNAIRALIRARTDTERATVFRKIEQGALLRIGRAYGVDGITGSTRSGSIIREMENIYKGIDERRTNLRSSTAKGTGVWEDADGVLNVVHGPKLRSTEPSTVTMLDLAGLERTTALTARAAFKERPIGTWKGAVTPSARQAALARMGNISFSAGQYFDMINMFFSNNVLLRTAYIFPNVIIDPLARASMDMESLFWTREMFPGLSNAVYNNSQRVSNGVFRARTWGSRRAARRDLNQKAADFQKAEAEVVKAEKSLAKKQKAGEDITSAQEFLDKKRSQLAKLEKITEASRAEYLRYVNEVGRRKANRAYIGSGRQARLQRVDGKILPRLVADERRWDFEVDGQNYSIPGIEDPNVKGVRAYQIEYDGFQSFLQAARTSEARDRRKALQGTQDMVPLKATEKNWPEYTNAVARFANKNLRNELDEVGGLILRGADVDEVLQWLSTPGSGAQYRSRILDLLKKKDRTPEGLRKWAEETIETTNRLFPTPEMRRIVLERDIMPEEVSGFLTGRSDLPTISGQMLEQTTASGVAKKIGRGWATGQELAWKGIGAMETRIARAPLFRQYVEQEMRSQVRAAQRAGIDVDVSVVHDRIRQIAYRRALSRVENTMYSIRNLTNAGWAARYLMAFPQAFFNSQIVAARLLWKNPANALYYENIIDMWDGFNPIVDDQGNEYKRLSDVPNDVRVTIQFPMQDKTGAVGAMSAAFAKLVQSAEDQWYDKDGVGGTKINPRVLEFMLGDASLSWFANINLSAIVSYVQDLPFMKVNGPEIAAWLRENMGDDFYERSIFYGGEPLPTTDPLTIAKGGLLAPYQTSVLNSANMKLGVTEPGLFTGPNYANRIASFIKMDAERAVREGRDPANPEEIVKAAAWSEFIRAAVQFNWYPSVVFDTRTSALMRHFGQLYEKNGNDGDAAEAEFVRLYGAPALAQLASTYKKTAGTPSTMRSVRIAEEEKDLLARINQEIRDPEYASFLFQSYGTEEDEYVGEARAFLRSNEYPGTDRLYLQRRDTQEMQDAAMERIGWYEFDQLQNWRASEMARLGILSTSRKRYVTSGLREEYDVAEKLLRERNPSWNNAYNQRRDDFWTQLFPAMRIAVTDDGFMRRQSRRIPVLYELQDWVANMEPLKYAYDQTKNTSAQWDNTQAKDAMIEWHQRFVENSSWEFQEFASRWLTLPEIDRTEELVQGALMMGAR